MNIDDSLVVVNSRRENAIEELLPSIRPNIPTGEYITTEALHEIVNRSELCASCVYFRTYITRKYVDTRSTTAPSKRVLWLHRNIRKS